MKRIFVFFVMSTYFVLNISGCISIPPATVEQQQQSKKFTLNENKATIYVLRGGGLRGAAWPVLVYIDGKYAGKLNSYNYLMYELEPGKHTIRGGLADFTAVEKEMVGGEMYFFSFRSSKPLVQEMKESLAKKNIMKEKMKMVETFDLKMQPIKFKEDVYSGEINNEAEESTSSD